jgi:hypothetical protein
MEKLLRYGGNANVWKGQYCGQEVAAKVLKIDLLCDLKWMRAVGNPSLGMCINGLIISLAEVLQGSYDMEVPSSSKCVATIRCNDGQGSVCDGIRVDGI